ncbi:MAG: hypothetical protein V4727_02815 [Verrucomicrobiota bacterium]
MTDISLITTDAAFDQLAQSGKVFWQFDEDERLLWAMACLRHHAGANGFRCIVEYDETAGFGVTAYAAYALAELGMDDLSEAANREWERVREEATKFGISIPGLYPRLNVDQLKEIQSQLHPEDGDWVAVTNPSPDDYIFIGIANSEFPERVNQWISASHTFNKKGG